MSDLAGRALGREGRGAAWRLRHEEPLTLWAPIYGAPYERRRQAAELARSGGRGDVRPAILHAYCGAIEPGGDARYSTLCGKYEMPLAGVLGLGRPENAKECRQCAAWLDGGAGHLSEQFLAAQLEASS